MRSGVSGRSGSSSTLTRTSTATTPAIRPTTTRGARRSSTTRGAGTSSSPGPAEGARTDSRRSRSVRRTPREKKAHGATQKTASCRATRSRKARSIAWVWSPSRYRQGTATAVFWIAAGQAYEDVRELDKLVRERTPASFLARTKDYWRLWANKDESITEHLPDDINGLYKRSTLAIPTPVHHPGPDIAPN